jgi:hypothetical protein
MAGGATGRGRVCCFSGLMGMEHLHPEVGVIEVGRMYREVPGVIGVNYFRRSDSLTDGDMMLTVRLPATSRCT